MASLHQWLWLLPTLAEACVVARILKGGRVRQHALLLGCLLTSLVVTLSAGFLQARLGQRMYAHFWVAAYVLIWSLTALALTESCTRSLQAYPRFAKVGLRIVQTVLTTTGLLIAGWLFLAPRSWTPKFFVFFQAQGHLVNASLALLGASILLFARWARLRLYTNSRRTTIVLTVLCTGEALLASGVAAAWPSAAFYVGITWATLCWSTLAVIWSPVEAEVGLEARGSDGLDSIAPELARMRSTTSRLEDLLRRG